MTRLPTNAERDGLDTQSAERKALEDCVGALQFILAFYDPTQRYLDTEAWKRACISGVAAYQHGAGVLGWTQRAMRAHNGEVLTDSAAQVQS